MIAFNGQYLPAASHGNMRITAACLGGQWVIGGKWLTHATQQAIIAAFGREEGIAVIRRTNDYLNALALTDPTRAQQLAMFINEDPLLVCSLVETSKTRWLVAAMENSDIETNIPFDGYDQIEWQWMQTSYSGSLMQFGSRTGGSGTAGIIVSLGKTIGNIIRIYNKAWATILSNTQDYKPYTTVLDFVNNKIIIDGVEYSHTFTEENKKAATFKIMDAVDGYISSVKAGDRTVAPYLNNGVAGWLDLSTLQFHSASKGTFTIQITDKTPLL